MTKPGFIEKRLKQLNAIKKPIHKFNSGMGATLCNCCSVIITTKFTDDLFCDTCKSEIENLNKSINYEI
jgi:hypothetical protein